MRTTRSLHIVLHRLRRALAPLAATLACALAAHAAADTVTLRSSTRVPTGSTVRIADVADLSGPDAVRIGSTAIAKADGGAFEIPLDLVRQKAIAAGADPSKIAFRGDRTVVRPMRGDAALASTPAADRPRSTEAGASTTVAIDPAIHAERPTPLGTICELVGNAHHRHGGALRLEIRRDDLARLEPVAGLRYEVIPRSALVGERVEFEVVGLSGSEVVRRERVRVDCRVEREVAIATRVLKRTAPVGSDDVRFERRLVSVGAAESVADPARVSGATLARSVHAEAIVRNDDLTQEVAIRKNDRVLVRREVGMVAIELEAIALEDGTAGQTIELERRGSTRARDSRRISAVVVGSGRAVIR